MTCIELQESLAEIDSGSSAAQQAHLKSCPHCSELVRELSLITSAAVELREADDPSPRVWNSIEIALRQEGLIHAPHPGRSLLPSLSNQWLWARWVGPVAAALLIVVGLYMRQHQQGPLIAGQKLADQVLKPATPAVSDAGIAGLNDDDLLQEIAEQSPAIQAQYTDNLRRVNEYIQDAKGTVDADPNDEEARRSLMDAYQQKAMLFELAMDRSLP